MKADKRDLDALKKFIQSALNKGDVEVDFKGLDALEDMIRRIEEIEKQLKNCLNLHDKLEIQRSLDDTNKSIKQINEVKLPDMNLIINSNATDLKLLKEQVIRLDEVKLDKGKFEEFMTLFRELKKKVDDILGRIGNLRDFSEDIKKLWDALNSLDSKVGD